MKVQTVLEEVLEQILPPSDKLREVALCAQHVVGELRRELRKANVRAEVLIGGSFAKSTLLHNSVYEVDVLVRCHDADMVRSLEQVSSVAQQISRKQNALLENIHGSREYFRIALTNQMVLEIVPVKHITHPKQAENVTDLSYLHVAYVQKQIQRRPALRNEILLAKAFCHAQSVYGAESYIKGFSGYALECLIIHYRSFLRMLRTLSETQEQLILDPTRQYHARHEVLVHLNESKRRSPVVLIDPTWKERNVCASLSSETFERFQKAAKTFLKNPSPRFFEKQEMSEQSIREEARKNKAEFLKLTLATEKQAGDIAGTKMRRGADFLARELEKRFDVMRKEFVYQGVQEATMLFILKPKKRVLLRGPPLEMKKHAQRFRKEHRKTFIKQGRLWVQLPKQNAIDFMKEFVRAHTKMLQGMDVQVVEIFS